jgi:membrane associated rhomboid family serine protease
VSIVPGPEGPDQPQGPDTQPGAAVPTCYRHPGRETYVSCVRCGRPACPDCLRDASVGSQCVDCVREGNRTTRVPGGTFGGRVPSGTPVVTWTLVGLNVVLFLIELAHQQLATDWAMVGRFPPDLGVAYGQWYRLITAAFLPPPGLNSSGILDIAFNMWALVIVGPALERQFGRVRYVAVYLVSAIGGSVLFYLLAIPTASALGASGAIFGLFAAWFVLSRKLRVDSRQVVTLIVLNLVISFVFRGSIAWQAHVGGLIAGGLLTAAYAWAPRRNRALVQAGATIVLLAVLVLGVVIRDHQLIGAVRF